MVVLCSVLILSNDKIILSTDTIRQQDLMGEIVFGNLEGTLQFD
jgi:hypothetical protein